MYCTNCGNEILNGSAFCGYCGQPVQTADVSRYTGPVRPAYQVPPAEPEMKIADIPGNIYESRNMSGMANATGEFILYNDRITLKATGNVKAQVAFGLIGSAIAAKSKRKKYGDYIMFNEICAADIVMRNNKESAIFIALTTGQEYSFVYKIKKYGNEAQRIMDYMKPRLG